jgi:hypothetical protein
VGLGAADDTGRMNIVLAAAGAHAVDISGCTIPTHGIVVGAAASCPGIFSDGSGSFTCSSEATSRTYLVQVFKSDFYVDRCNFAGPVSSTRGLAPACGKLLSFDGVAAETDRLRLTNCRFKGAGTAVILNNTNGCGYVEITGNIISDTWGDATICQVPRQLVFSNNLIHNCGVDPAATDSACHFTTQFSTVPSQNLVVTNNIVKDCCIGFTQEAFDLYGLNLRNAVFANNIIDGVGYGGFEFKADRKGMLPNTYGDVLIANNVVNFVEGGTGIGVALNNSGSPDHYMTRFKIVGNYFLCDGAGSPRANGINVGPQDNVDIIGNTFQNIRSGIQVNAAGTTREVARNVVIQSNTINVSGAGIFCPARSISSLVIIGNSIVAGEQAFRCTGARVSHLVCTGNHLETRALIGCAVELANIQTGRILYNTLVATGSGLMVGGAPSTDLQLRQNDVNVAAGDAFVVRVSGTVLISDNVCSLAAGSRIVSGSGTYSAVNNSRGVSAEDPTGTLAGSIGDIVWQAGLAAGAGRGWICTVPGGIGEAVYKRLPIRQ